MLRLLWPRSKLSLSYFSIYHIHCAVSGYIQLCSGLALVIDKVYFSQVHWPIMSPDFTQLWQPESVNTEHLHKLKDNQINRYIDVKNSRPCHYFSFASPSTSNFLPSQSELILQHFQHFKNELEFSHDECASQLFANPFLCHFITQFEPPEQGKTLFSSSLLL